MNVVTLTGRIAREVKASDSGKTATATIAVNRPYPFEKNGKGEDVADFLTLRFIGERNVSRAAKYLSKGKKIDLRGIVCRDSWKDDKGDWREFNFIIVQEWEFGESKAAEQERSGSASNMAKGGETGLDLSDDDDFMEIGDDADEMGIPFD